MTHYNQLWLDDIRDPNKFSHADWYWVKTASHAIYELQKGDIKIASLDHDLTQSQMEIGGYNGRIHEDGVMSGYDVILYLEQHPQYWPPYGVSVHSQNPAGRQRMEQAINRHYGRTWPTVLTETTAL